MTLLNGAPVLADNGVKPATATLIGAQSQYATLAVSALVQPSAMVRFASTLDQLRIDETDIARGYVDLPGTVQLQVRSGASSQRVLNVTVEVEPNADVKSMDVRARAANALSPVAGQTADRRALQDILLGYRVNLSEKTGDSSYSVPVTLTINL
ncbi:MAG TPA: hypothetical protein VLN59_16400 [Burkholderiales bacterium]|nr:hypothetical protein [Burkholderiales bacterium]